MARTATYTRAYAESNGFLTLLSDGERLTGAYALGPEAGEWLQQATLAIRAGVPLDVLRDTIQPFPTFSEIYIDALKVPARRHRGGARAARCEARVMTTAPTSPSPRARRSCSARRSSSSAAARASGSRRRGSRGPRAPTSS